MNEDDCLDENCEGECEDCFNRSYCKQLKEEQKIRNCLQDKIKDLNELKRLEKKTNF